ncbi:hypothetical protein MHK_003526, partial [Candidatus Magnetomorum sp. HK-1]
QLAQKNALPFPNEFVQAFMRFLEQLLCPIIDDRLDAPGSLKQLKRLKDIIHPQIIQFEVNCPETVCINTSYVMTINARYKGLPFISKWLTIQDKTHNNTIEITEIKKTDKNQYQVILPGMAHEGRYQLSIIPFDPAYTKICQIQIHITPEVSWERKNYEVALLAYKHPDYAKWLGQIENEARQSENNCNNWLKILSKVTRDVSIEERPDLYILCGQLLAPDKPVQKTKPNKILHKFVKTGLISCFILFCIYCGYIGQQRLYFFDKFESERAQIEAEKKQLKDKQDQIESDKQQFENRVKQLKSDRKRFELERAQIEAEKKQLKDKQEQFTSDKLQFNNKVKQLKADRNQLESEKAKFVSENQKMNKKHDKDLEIKHSQSKKTVRVKPNRGNITTLRSKPKTLSYDEITAIIKKYNFSDTLINTSGNFENAYIDNHDGTVTDKKTGLMWQQGGSDD